MNKFNANFIIRYFISLRCHFDITGRFSVKNFEYIITIKSIQRLYLKNVSVNAAMCSYIQWSVKDSSRWVSETGQIKFTLEIFFYVLG